MSVYPSVSWSEVTPAGTDAISAGDDRMRELKTQIREVIAVDHDFPSSGQATDNGQHKQVTLQEAADLGTGAVGTTILGSQTISTRGELVYTNEDDVDIQLTKGDTAYPSQSTTLADWSKIMALVYPIGSVVTLGVSTNPATLFGIGTWIAIEGKVIVGIAGSGTFDTLDETGGAETVTLDATMIPAHTHTWTDRTTGDATGGMDTAGNYSPSTANTGSTGGGLAHENMPPYIVKYVWQRTA